MVTMTWQLCPALLYMFRPESAKTHAGAVQAGVAYAEHSLPQAALAAQSQQRHLPSPGHTQEEQALDPLPVLRCDNSELRTGPILQIVLYMMKACLAPSRTRLSQYLVDQHPASPALLNSEREELRNSLAQESATIQILMECCQEEVGRLRAVQETRESRGAFPGIYWDSNNTNTDCKVSLYLTVCKPRMKIRPLTDDSKDILDTTVIA